MRIPVVILLLIGGIHSAVAQGVQFFQIFGPSATSIIAFNPDGTLVWSNTQSGTNYTIQTCSSLAGGSNWVNYVQLPVTNNVNTNQIVAFNPPAGMAFIPAGSFTMGDKLDGESDAPPTDVYVSGFYMDVNLVSYGQWQTVYNWAINNGYGFVNAGAGKAADYPVQTVTWYDCVKWCNARSQQEGLTPVYYTDAGFTEVYTNGQSLNPPQSPYANWTASGYRLPTEAEWEKAARGGLKGLRFPWGDSISESQANYQGDTNKYSYDLGPNYFNPVFTNGFPYESPVGYFAPNGYGLYDMAGNVEEWCWDYYAPTYAGGSDPRGPTQSTGRVFRGGDWGFYADYARCAHRQNEGPDQGFQNFGFRCVRGR
jgi:formylglycine-generating enzyme